jgi:hypothetical protein
MVANMGIFLDTIEDNQERGWHIDVQRDIDRVSQAEPSTHSPSKNCPTCNRMFFSDKDLQDHIFSEHRHELIETSLECSLIVSEADYTNLPLAEAAQDYWNAQVEFVNHGYLDLDQLNSHIHQPRNHPGLAKYYEGVMTYLEVAHFEKNSKSGNANAIKRLERVYGYLQPFDDFISQQICHTIAFRFHWIDVLKNSPKSSIFYLAYIFFSSKFEEIEYIKLPAEAMQRRGDGIYISENADLLLELIVLFFEERVNKSKFKKLLRELEDENSKNIEFHSKFNLIAARIYRKLELYDQARQYYRRLNRDHRYSMESAAYPGLPHQN